jgi:hypothetical protein
MHSYPIVFAVAALPLTVVRLITGFGSATHHLPAATFAVECIYSLSGALNVILILLTRSPLLLPRGASRDRNKLGVAPSVSLPKSRRGFSEVSRPDSPILDIGTGNKPVPLGHVRSLSGKSNADWHLALPSSKHDSAESV